MTSNINSVGKPTPIKTGGCPECGMAIQRAGKPDAYCGWCPWPDYATSRAAATSGICSGNK